MGRTKVTNLINFFGNKMSAKYRTIFLLIVIDNFVQFNCFKKTHFLDSNNNLNIKLFVFIVKWLIIC
jgi:hypothetical protein